MKKGLKLLAVPALALTLLSGCGGGGTNERLPDALNVLPENVLNYEGDIDIYIYIEGQLGAMLDIGHKDYEYTELWDAYFAKFYAAAKEFNKYVPGAKINLYYCSIADYNTNIASYATAKGHIPHVMHATDHVNEMISKGYATDLSIYSESPYYKIFDETIMAEFNFGGFQGAIPYMVYPMGVFVNTDILDENYVEYNDEYVEAFTMEQFYEDLETITDEEVAGLSQPVEWFTSIAAPSVYKSFVYDQSVDLDDTLVYELLSYEQNIINYSAYKVNGSGTGWTPKDNYSVNSWETSYNFIEDEAFAFSAEMPWNVGLLSVLAGDLGKSNFDLLPYPMANEETDAHVGMLAEGLTIGNQCPVLGEECPQASIDARDTAAYFTMFMNADPRAIKAKAEIEYTDAQKSRKIVGALDLPMVKRGFEYDWGEEGNASGVSPEAEVFSYQLDLYLKNYTMYWDYDSEDPNSAPDVKEYTNIKPGFKRVLEIFYDEPENRVNFYGRPDNVPDQTGTGTKDILGDWSGRMLGTTPIGTTGWLGYVESNLSVWEQDINENIGISYDYLAEQMAMYYGEGIYFQD